MYKWQIINILYFEELLNNCNFTKFDFLDDKVLLNHLEEFFFFLLIKILLFWIL